MKLTTTVLAFCVATLLTVGIVMLYSSSMVDQGTRYLLMQLLWCAIGLAGCAVAAALDYQILRKLALPVLLVAVGLLVLVLIPPFGIKMNGARRWFRLPVHEVSFQPSELGKLALILALAWYGDRFQRQMGGWRKGLLLPGLLMAPVLGLIFIEPDRGSTILLGCVAGCILLLAGARWKFILPPAVLGAVFFAFSLMLDPVRRERILAWLHPADHKLGAGLQADYAMLALGSGGWTGLGLGNSRQKLGFLPFHNTDFILPIVGEELGLVGTLLVLVAFALVVWCGLHIAARARDTFGALLASGATLLIGFQAIFNMGVVTNLLPNKGLPLPFISYGGSNLLLMLTCVGLLIGVARKSPVAGQAGEGAFDADVLPAPQAT